MNAEVNQNHGSGNWIAFLLGAIFNILASINFSVLLEHALIALIGGVIWLVFQIIANRILKGSSKPNSTKRKHGKS
jgi:hypothetical protein